MLNESNINGVKWVKRWRISNGKEDSYVIPFPTSRPMNVVSHGQGEFDYGQYGIHLGQEDSLTFLGDPSIVIKAKFIDCRKDSETFRNVFEFSFNPSTDKTLSIPPGVAHTFYNLGKVHVINDYSLFLPDIEQLISSSIGWSPENDIINLPEDISIEDINGFTPMKHHASDALYDIISEHQNKVLQDIKYKHPETREFILDSGEKINVMIKEKIVDDIKDDIKVSKIDGVMFNVLPSIKTGETSEIVPIARNSPFYIVDHGTEHYDFDSYGLHLGQEDRLIFLGNEEIEITLHLIDMRAGSKTLHVKDEIKFSPSSHIELVIPRGVAHALMNLANVYTVNRPLIYTKEDGSYLPGNDVIDWPFNNLDYPSYEVNPLPADTEYYNLMILNQKELMESPSERATPKSVLVFDEENNKYVKVMIKQIVQ